MSAACVDAKARSEGRVQIKAGRTAEADVSRNKERVVVLTGRANASN